MSPGDEGLADGSAHRGVQLRSVRVKELAAALRLRSQIEPPAVVIGARRAEPADRDVAHRALLRLNQALAANDWSAAWELNRDFHVALLVPRVQPVTADIVKRLHALGQRHVALQPVRPSRIWQVTALYQAWALGRTKEASVLSRTHIEDTRADLAKAVPR